MGGASAPDDIAMAQRTQVRLATSDDRVLQSTAQSGRSMDASSLFKAWAWPWGLGVNL
jgi:hypothetical protein